MSSIFRHGSNKKNDCRVLAAEVISAVINNKASLATLLPNALGHIAEKDQSLLRELCYGTLRHYFSLSEMVTTHLAKPLRIKDNDIFALLLIGAYQLHHTRIPAYAAINSSVAAANSLKKTWAKSLINAVLRNIQRDMEKSADEQSGDLSVKQLNEEVRCDHPQWLIDEIKKDYNAQATEIFLANNSKAPMTLRVNQQQLQRDAYLALLKQHSIAASVTALSGDGIRLDVAVDVSKLPGFDQGAVSVQDEAAQLCATLLRLSRKQHVLDACAAPGGKTCHILEIEPSTSVIALDIDQERNQLIYENLQRLHLNAEVITADATDTETWWRNQAGGLLFDRILLDAPCSATGVIRHHPDIKLLRKTNDIAALAQIQLRLLNALWPLLKPDGVLLYTTCSILSKENDAVVQQFINSTTDAAIDAIDAGWGIKTTYGRQLLPQLNGHDGFYFSRLKKMAGKQIN